MLTPGAKRSRQVPKFEELQRASVAGTVAPTVMATGVRLGAALPPTPDPRTLLMTDARAFRGFRVGHVYPHR